MTKTRKGDVHTLHLRVVTLTGTGTTAADPEFCPGCGKPVDLLTKVHAEPTHRPVSAARPSADGFPGESRWLCLNCAIAFLPDAVQLWADRLREWGRAGGIHHRVRGSGAHQMTSLDWRALDWTAAVETQVCPLCHRGPFLMLAKHTEAKHDIDRFELRELAGLAKSDSACAPEHAEACHDRAVAVDAAAALPHTKGPRGTLDWSTAGLQRLRDRDHSSGIEAARKVKLARTHCRHGHLYSPENTRIGSQEGDRICLTCARDACRRHRAKAKA